jgi:hypothetical protein
MLRQMKAGTTSGILPLFLQDSSSSTGAGLAGLVYNSAGLTCYYKRSDGTAAAAVTLADITTLGTWVSGGFKAIDGTNAPGLYEFHPPDAALASGAKWVAFYFKGATNLAQTPVLVELTATDNQDAAQLLDLAAGVETSRTLRQSLRLILAALVGKLSGAAGTTVTVRDTNDAKDRVVATVDSDGNRSNVVLDAS